MPRPDKVAVVDEVREGLSNSAATLLTHYRGLSVTELAQLRAKLREANAEMRVAKNTLARRAAADAGIEGLEELLTGPTGLVFCQEDPVGPAKALRDFAKDHPDLVVRGGYLDGAVLSEAEATRLAELESREDLLAKLAGLMYGALANTARLLKAPIEQQARLVQALIDAGGYAGAPADAPAEEPAGAETAAAAEAADGAPATEAADDAPATEAADAAEEAAAAPAEDAEA
ncbi:50S ribosomal protein L10 [Egicoccus sp. AB-alg2]|uniref:50S ribosomal protein L10 n=1 Tax=Egicoccus sp. AB-alg2 TaxID=3242693 RepID=UPI00359E891B